MRCSSSLPSPHPRSTIRFTPLCSSTPVASILSLACTAFFAQHVHGMRYARLCMYIKVHTPQSQATCLTLLQNTPCDCLLGSIACNRRPAEQGTAHEGCSDQQRCIAVTSYQQLSALKASSRNTTEPNRQRERYLPPMHASAAIEEDQTGVQWGLQTQGTYDPGRSCADCSEAKGRHQSATLGHPRGETLGQQPCLQCPTCAEQHALNQLTCKAWML